jgi:HSP20 family protein
MALPVRQRNGNNTLQRWDPFTELTHLTNQLEQILGSGVLPAIPEEGFTPLADIEETGDAYLVEVELPGVKPDDITVEASGNRVAVSGERKERVRTGNLRRRGRAVGRFTFEVALPSTVARDDIDASLQQGVLTLRVPKSAGERPKKITVK